MGLTSLEVLLLNDNILTGSIPSGVGELTLLQYLSIGQNNLSSTIPSVIGELSSMIGLYLTSNALSGTIPSELGQLTDLDYLELGNNDLTGSIPTELIFNKTYINFDVYGNELSNLTPVDGKAICANDGSEGEHYCDCSRDCTFNSERCACEEAQACCSTYTEQFTPCIVCDEGVQNPDFYVDEWSETCSGGAEFVKNELEIYGNPTPIIGTATVCSLIVKFVFNEEGCRCEGDLDNAAEYTPCIICEEGVEDPDFYSEQWEMTCSRLSDMFEFDVENFGTSSQCDIARSAFEDPSAGCRCKGNVVKTLASSEELEI